MNEINCFDEKDLSNLPFQLGILRNARHYQNWMIDAIKPFLGKRILEVGSGIGNMSRWLPVRDRLILSDIDESLILHLQKTVNCYFDESDKVSIFKVDMLMDWKKELAQENLDTIVSFNVLEHIQEDKKFFSDLIYILKKSSVSRRKNIITVVPAHQFAYGETDRYYAHYRRYSYRALKELRDDLAPEAKFYCRYFNVVGLPGWIFCGRILKKKGIGIKEVSCFEKICPWIRKMDDFLHVKMCLPLGQSIISVVTLN